MCKNTGKGYVQMHLVELKERYIQILYIEFKNVKKF